MFLREKKKITKKAERENLILCVFKEIKQVEDFHIVNLDTGVQEVKGKSQKEHNKSKNQCWRKHEATKNYYKTKKKSH